MITNHAFGTQSDIETMTDQGEKVRERQRGTEGDRGGQRGTHLTHD